MLLLLSIDCLTFGIYITVESNQILILAFYFIIVSMSYGWLTESALLPKKSKTIKIDDQGNCFALKAVIDR